MVWFDGSLRFQLCESGIDSFVVIPPIKTCFSGMDAWVDPGFGVTQTGFDGWTEGR